MKTYGLVLADNGSPWFFQGEQNASWPTRLVEDLKKIPARAFVAVDTSVPEGLERQRPGAMRVVCLRARHSAPSGTRPDSGSAPPAAVVFTRPFGESSSTAFGLWRSLVAHLTGGQGVAGSNPVSPTRTDRRIFAGQYCKEDRSDYGRSGPSACRVHPNSQFVRSARFDGAATACNVQVPDEPMLVLVVAEDACPGLRRRRGWSRPAPGVPRRAAPRSPRSRSTGGASRARQPPSPLSSTVAPRPPNRSRNFDTPALTARSMAASVALSVTFMDR